MYKFLHMNEFDDLSILLGRDIRVDVIDEIVSSFNGQREFGRKNNIKQYTISRWRTGKVFIPVSFLKYVETIKQNFKVQDIEKEVELIGSKQGSIPLKMKFPIKVDENFGYLMGLIITDGHIDKDLNWVHFFSKYNELVRIFLDKINTIFNYNGFYSVPSDPKQIFIKNKVIATIMWKAGIPKGYKTSIAQVSKIIMSSNNSVIRSFLKGCFDGDGSVAYSPKYGSRIINFASTSPQMLEDISELLSRFEIKANVSKRQINITNIKNLEKFYKEINFNHPIRKVKLKEVLDSYKIKN